MISFGERILTAVMMILLLAGATHAATEPRTGVNFPDKFKGASLSKWGVRTKGPIKVYAVGQYDNSFLLQMTFGIGAEKMASALTDALKPRCSDKGKMDEFRALLVQGLPNGCPKGTQLAFGTGGGKLSLEVNGKNVGSIGSKPLATGFGGIYTDRNAVCAMTPPVSGDGGVESTQGLNIPKNLVTAIGWVAIGCSVGYLLDGEISTTGVKVVAALAVGWGVGKLLSK